MPFALSYSRIQLAVVAHVSRSTSEFRNAFLRTIRQIIRESVRNMTVPATKPAVREKPGTLRRLGGGNGHDSGPSSAAAGPSTSSMSRTLSGKKRNKSQRHSAGDAIESYDNVTEPRLPGPSFRGTRSKTVTDSMNGMSASARDLASEEAGDSERSDRSDRSERSLGAPKALSLSSASSLSSSSAAARLIQSSNPPTSYQPAAEQAGSPVWKPRASSADRAGPSGLNRPDVKEQFFVYEDYGGGGAAVYQQRSQPSSSSSRQSEC